MRQVNIIAQKHGPVPTLPIGTDRQAGDDFSEAHRIGIAKIILGPYSITEFEGSDPEFEMLNTAFS